MNLAYGIMARPGATFLEDALVAVIFRKQKPWNSSIPSQPALALRGRISLQSLYGTRCSDQPIKPLSQVWARGLGQGMLEC